MNRLRLIPLVLLSVGCTPDLPRPELSAVTPDWGWTGEEVRISLEGSQFYPGVHISGREDPRWDRQYRAWLSGDDGEIELTAIDLDSTTRIGASVPAGTLPGRYDLVLQAPGGEEDVLADAYRVTETRADHLAVSPELDVVDVGEPVLVRVSLLDPDGVLVSAGLAITAVVDADIDPGAVTFSEENTLSGQEPLEDQIGIRGELGLDGQGSFGITVSEPADLAVLINVTDADAGIEGASASLTWAAGDLSGVKITVHEPGPYTAGDTLTVDLELVDADGYPTEDIAAVLYLHEACAAGSLGQTVYVLGALTDHEVTITGATNERCDENAIVASGVSADAQVEGQSDPFEVSPALPARFSVVASPATVIAGQEPLSVWIRAEDPYGNVVEDYTGTPVLRDSVGGLDPDLGLGAQTCSPFSSGLAFSSCEAWLWVASDAVTLQASDEAGLDGTSNTVRVAPGTIDRLTLELVDTPVVAGGPFSVVLTALDDLDNPIDLPFGAAGDLSFSAHEGEVTCLEIDSDPDGGTTYTCTLIRADDADVLTAVLVAGGGTYTASSSPFEVQNGPLHQMDIALSDTTVAAGGTLSLVLTGVDAYNNPYLDGTDRDVALSDLSGTLAIDGGATTVALDSEGQAQVDTTYTLSWENNQVTASQGGTELGSSAPFDVVAGALDHYTVELPATWTWIDEETEVEIAALDVYNNPVTTYAEALTLRSVSGLGDDVVCDDWSDGVATVAFTFSEPGLQDTLELLLAGEAVVTSAPVDALDAGCDNGPSADLTVAGDAPAILCLTSGATPSTTLSGVGSTAGDGALVAWHFDSGQGSWSRSSSSTTTAVWDEEGAYPVKLVVADEDACGALARTEVYVAESDGRPAGPISLTIADTTLNAGTDTTAVTAEVYDCAGDPADGELQVWADRGGIEKGSLSTLDRSGAGLVVEVFGGYADLSWSMVDVDKSGDAILHVGTPTGGAYGIGEATVSGDAARPYVLAQTPSGSTTESFDSIDLLFSEAIPGRYLTDSTVQLLGSTGTTPTLMDVAQSTDQTEVTLTFDSTLARGVWTLTLTTDVRDTSGNKLDGTWRFDGTATDYNLTFGEVPPAAPDVTGCAPLFSTFRPDGDDGDDEEADQVTLTTIATSLPAWWRITVRDTSADRIYTGRVAADAATADLYWDGRDQTGKVVDNGPYLITISAEDAYWNIAVPCSAQVWVDNLVTGLP